MAKVGTIVHYVAYGRPECLRSRQHLAAIVTHEPQLGIGVHTLTVFSDSGECFIRSGAQDELTKPAGTWHLID